MGGPAHARVRASVALLIAGSLAGCVSLHADRAAPGEQPVLTGTPARENVTPLDPAYACFAAKLGQAAPSKLVIAVGDVRDFTGKYSVNEGTAITQGGALMVASALGKLGGPITLAERFDPTIAERELGYTDRRQLGDGQSHTVNGGPAATVPWLPYYGGSITASDYYIVGGITELNYNIRSGGAELRVASVGPKLRTFTQSVAIDLRIVDTKSLLVVRTISLTKQIVGYEVGFNTFRFFGSNLFDVNIGEKAQEPLQLGIRAAIEEATLRLVGAVTRVDPGNCLKGTDPVAGPTPTWPAVDFAAHAEVEAGMANRPTAMSNPVTPIALAFEPGSDVLSPAALRALDAVQGSRSGASATELLLLSRDSEVPDPALRAALTDRRIAAVLARLAVAGIPARSVTLMWRPSATDTERHGDTAGFQRIARLRVTR